MEIEITKARMVRNPEQGFVGSVEFEVEGHLSAYEIVLQSKSGRDWDYALVYAGSGGGRDEDMDAVEAAIETDDELFDRIIDAAEAALGESE